MRAPWHALHRNLALSTESLSFTKSFAWLRQQHPALFPYLDLPSLLNFLHAASGDPDSKNTVLRALIAEAQTVGEASETAKVVLILARWPGLDAAHGRLLRQFRNDPDRLATELAGRIAAGISTLDLTRVSQVAATLLRNVERDIRRMLAKERGPVEVALTDDLADSLGWDGLHHPGHFGGSVDGLVRRLKQIVGDDAFLVIAVAVFGMSQKEASASLGLSHDAARKRYQRAIARLQNSYPLDG